MTKLPLELKTVTFLLAHHGLKETTVFLKFDLLINDSNRIDEKLLEQKKIFFGNAK